MTDASKIWEKYVIVNEVSRRYIDEVMDAVDISKLPFNDIFGNQLRLVIPIKGTDTYKEILDVIKKLPNYKYFDADKKEIVKQIKLDPAHGGGIKEQRINLGKALSSLLKLPDDLKKKYLNWYANYNSNIPEMDALDKYSIIISRSPIDVLRMSDSSAIRSCHSQGGSYFNCAIAEAKSGGPIAYLVKTDDVKKLSSEELQNEEIFKDPDRKVNGIVPLARLRIRRYVIDAEQDLAVPEIRIYGERLSGFYDSVKEFLKQKQMGLNIDTIYKQYKNRDIIRTGGSYTDSSDSELFNRMFETDTFTGSLAHLDGGEDRVNQFDTELREFHQRYINNIRNFNIGYDIQDDGDDDNVYYTANASIGIDLSDYDGDLELTDDFPDTITADEFRSIEGFNPNGKFQWQKNIPYYFKNDLNAAIKFKTFLSTLKKLDTTGFFKDDFSGIYVGNNNNIYLNVCFGDGCDGFSYNTDDYLDFCRKVSEYDGLADKIKEIFVIGLKQSGYVNIDDPEYVSIDPEKFNDKLNVFSFEKDDNEFLLSDRIVLTINTDKVSYEYFEKLSNMKFINNDILEDLNTAIGKFLNNYIKMHYKPFKAKSDNQLKFKQFMESYNFTSLEFNNYGILSSEVDLSQTTVLDRKSNVTVNSTLRLTISDLTSKVSDLLLFLDKHSDDIIRALNLCVRIIYKIEDTYTKNLRKVYGKYFNTK